MDVPVYPSYPAILTANIDASFAVADAAVRFAHIEALAARGLLEFAVIDPGSVNFTLTATMSAAKPAGTYLNPESHVRHALDFAARYGFHPAFAIYEPGFTRAGAALARAASVKTPIYRFMLSEQFAFGFPPKPYAPAAHLALLEEEAGPAPWMIAGLGANNKAGHWPCRVPPRIQAAWHVENASRSIKVRGDKKRSKRKINMPLVLRTVCRNRVPTHSSDPGLCNRLPGLIAGFAAAFAARRCASVGPREKYRPAFDHLEGGRACDA